MLILIGITHQIHHFLIYPILHLSGFLGNVGNINLRYCWMPPCNYLGDTLQLDLDAYSIDCSGFNPIEADIYVHVDPIPQETTFDYVPLTSITLDTSLCIYVFAEDSVKQ